MRKPMLAFLISRIILNRTHTCTVYGMKYGTLYNHTYTIGVAPITQYTHVRNKNSSTQGSSPYVEKSDFSYLKELLLKGKNSLPLGANYFFKRRPHFKKGRKCTESLLDTVVSPWCA